MFGYLLRFAAVILDEFQRKKLRTGIPGFRINLVHDLVKILIPRQA